MSRPDAGRWPSWTRSSARAELLALYAEADALTSGWTCACTPGEAAPEPRCCHFAVTGRQPYPTAVELEEVLAGARAAGAAPRDPRRLPVASLGACPLLSPEGRCRVYASRPLGCRTFFCDDAQGPFGARARPARASLGDLARRIADLSARTFPRDPGPRPLVGALGALGAHGSQGAHGARSALQSRRGKAP